MSVADVFEQDRFFHVTPEEAVQEVKRTGLQPARVTGKTNFPDLFVDPDCVYLWPTVSAAQHYVWGGNGAQHRAQRRMILEASGIALGDIHPDQEFFANWHDTVAYDPDDPDSAELFQLVREDLGDHAPDLDDELTFAESARLIGLLSPKARLLLANVAALRGEALMCRREIPSAQLSALTLNTWDTVVEKFDEEHPEFSTDAHLLGDRDEERFEALDSWMMTQGREIVEEDEYRQRLTDDPDELAYTDDLKYYSVTPLTALHSRGRVDDMQLASS
jgi:hypothetical protein